MFFGQDLSLEAHRAGCHWHWEGAGGGNNNQQTMVCCLDVMGNGEVSTKVKRGEGEEEDGMMVSH